MQDRFQQIDLPKFNINSKNYKFLRFLEGNHITYDEFLQKLYVNVVEGYSTVLDKKAFDTEITCYIDTINEKEEIGRIWYYYFIDEKPMWYYLSNDYFHGLKELPSFGKKYIQSFEDFYKSADILVIIPEAIIDERFRSIGLMNYFIQYIKDFIVNNYKKYMIVIKYESFGNKKVDNPILKRFYMSYGFQTTTTFFNKLNGLDYSYYENHTLICTNML